MKLKADGVGGEGAAQQHAGRMLALMHPQRRPRLPPSRLSLRVDELTRPKCSVSIPCFICGHDDLSAAD